MSYTYGMKGAPAVGGGLGGLPSRADIGEIRQFSVAPSNDWLPCDGSIYLKSAYPELARKLPNSYYGVGTTPYTPVSDILTNMSCGEHNGESAFVLSTNGSSPVVFYVAGGRVASSAFVLSTVRTSLNYLGGGKWIAFRPADAQTGSHISYDNARTWTANAAATTNIRGACGDELGNIYIACNNVTNSIVQKSTNNGVSWTTKTTITPPGTGIPSQNCICYVGNGVLFFLRSTGNMQVSYNYGETWSNYTNNTLLTTGLQTAVYSNGKGVVFAKTQALGGAGDYILVASYNYGVTWVSTAFSNDTDSEFNLVCSYGSDIWSVTTPSLGAYISTNNTKSFNCVGIRSDFVSLGGCATTSDASYSYALGSSPTGTISYLSNAFSVPSISGTNQYIKAR